MFIPKITVKKSDINFNINYITDLLTPQNTDCKNTSLPFKDRVYGRLPELKYAIRDNMTKEQVQKQVEAIIKNEYKSNEIDKRILYVQNKFDKLVVPFLSSLLDIFNLKWDNLQHEITCYLGCYPVFPRNIFTKEFWVNYNSKDENIIKGAAHEINHFMLYEKWKTMHQNSTDVEYNYPNPIWFLEEIIVDPTLNESSIQSIIPYAHKAYVQFYTKTIGGITIMDRIKDMYKSKTSIEDFLNNVYEFIVDNLHEFISKCG
ncbi:hypothetical protein [Clostridium hydrogenum]|uniref:hypothetical protein n=1 Tax=Clostridium hydrogenum TaxID=2855764 RepID=UPI001F4484BB|nr:hypothetical protein [Clostridium hydrogenum]